MGGRLCRGQTAVLGLVLWREGRSAFAKHLARRHALPPRDGPGGWPGPERLSHLLGHSCRDPFSPALAPRAEPSPAMRSEPVSRLLPSGEGTWGVRAATRASGPATQRGACSGHGQERLIFVSVFSPVRWPSGPRGGPGGGSPAGARACAPQLTRTGSGSRSGGSPRSSLGPAPQGWLLGVCSAGKHLWLPLTSSG